MPDPAARRTQPLDTVSLPVGPGLRSTATPPMTRLILHGLAAADAAGQAFGVAMPLVPCRAATRGDRAALWLGPDEWLLLDLATVTAAGAADLQRTLANAIGQLPHSLVDVSHRQTGIAIEGRHAGLALNAFVPLDLAIEAFPAGMATRTIFEKAEIVLWRRAPETFHIEVWRSLAPYVAALLREAQMELAADENR